jgi:hypothetical protein
MFRRLPQLDNQSIAALTLFAAYAVAVFLI